MRNLTHVGMVALICLGGCILSNTYEYEAYEFGAGGNGSIASSISAGGDGAGGSIGGNGGQGGVGGALDCPADECNDGKDDVCRNKPDCTVSAQSANGYGSPTHQAIKALHVTPDLDGAVAFAGDFVGTFSIAGLSLAPPVQTVFYPFAARIADSSGSSYAHYIAKEGAATAVRAVDQDMYVAGHFFEMAQPPQKRPKVPFIKRFTPTGDPAPTGWQRELGAHPDNAIADIDVSATAMPPLFVAGTIDGTGPFPDCPQKSNYAQAGRSTFILQLEPSSGDCTWAMTIDRAITAAMAVKDDTLVVVGYYTSADIEWTEAPDPQGTSAFIASYGIKSRKVVWKKFFVTSDSGIASFLRVVIDQTTGNIYAAGTVAGTLNANGKTWIADSSDSGPDLMVAGFSPAGDVLWMDRFGGTGLQEVQGITLVNGQLVLSGKTAAEMAFENDQDIGPLCATTNCMFMLGLEATNGAPVWARSFGGGEMATDAIAVIGNNKQTLWLGGGWSTQVDFGSKTLIPMGGQDAFLAQFTLNPFPK